MKEITLTMTQQDMLKAYYTDWRRYFFMRIFNWIYAVLLCVLFGYNAFQSIKRGAIGDIFLGFLPVGFLALMPIVANKLLHSQKKRFLQNKYKCYQAQVIDKSYTVGGNRTQDYFLIENDFAITKSRSKRISVSPITETHFDSINIGDTITVVIFNNGAMVGFNPDVLNYDGMMM